MGSRLEAQDTGYLARGSAGDSHLISRESFRRNEKAVHCPVIMEKVGLRSQQKRLSAP
jgi:hypothetical protein